MLLSELVKKLEEFKTIHGDVEIDTEYRCDTCSDYHEGNGLELDLTGEGKLKLSVIELGG